MDDHHHHHPNHDEIVYRWPEIQIPATSLARFIREKFHFYWEQIFLIDHGNGLNFQYKHVYNDVVRVGNLLRAKKITTISTIGIVCQDNYETIIILLATILLQAKIILLDQHSTKEQIRSCIQHGSITNLIVNSNNQQNIINHSQSNNDDDDHHVMNGGKLFKDGFSINFGEQESDDERENEAEAMIINNNKRSRSPSSSESYLVSKLSLNLDNFGNQSPDCGWNTATGSDPKRPLLIVPRFKENKLIKFHQIDERSLLTQLTYAILPKCGFEWTINEIVLHANPLSTVIGVLELLTTILTGAQIVINHGLDSAVSDYPSMFVDLVDHHHITACIMDSSLLTELLKSDLDIGRSSLHKILYIRQPLHKNIVMAFKNRFNIGNCRFAFYLPEASGLAAIETLDFHQSNSMIPLPLMRIKIVDQLTGVICSKEKLGKIFIQSPYCSETKTVEDQIDDDANDDADKDPKNIWIYTGYVGYYDRQSSLQIIDFYANFIQFEQKLFSKTLIETILLSQDSVHRAMVSGRVHRKPNGIKFVKILVTLKHLADRSKEDEDQLLELLNTYLTDIPWQLNIVPSLPAVDKTTNQFV